LSLTVQPELQSCVVSPESRSSKVRITVSLRAGSTSQDENLLRNVPEIFTD
jgi:hypothetical protein